MVVTSSITFMRRYSKNSSRLTWLELVFTIELKRTSVRNLTSLHSLPVCSCDLILRLYFASALPSWFLSSNNICRWHWCISCVSFASSTQWNNRIVKFMTKFSPADKNPRTWQGLGTASDISKSIQPWFKVTIPLFSVDRSEL